MALYTTLLRSIVEQRQTDAHVGPDDFTVAYATLGLDGYPIFDENYRQTLNDKIIRHFYFREIGQETVARFRWYVDMTMRENMPYFNQLYQSLNLIVDPITNVRYTYRDVFELATEETGTGTTSRTGSGSTSETETHAGDDVTEAEKGTTRTETTDHGHTETTTTEHGHTLTDTRDYGHTETETLDHGHTLTDSTDYGRQQDTTDSTTYGRTEATVNGGSDQTLEGATKEREIRSDTPMNQIPTGAIEAGNYATEATYTEREGQRAGTTTYGGTTNVTFGGNDGTTQNVVTSGTDTTTHEHTGQDVTTKSNAGEDVITRADTGTDVTTKSNAGEDVITRADTGTDTTTLTHGETVTTEGTTSTTEGIETGDTRTIGTDTTKDHTGSGYQGTSPSKLLEEYRKTFLNVDMQVIASLESLFFGLWE